MNAIEQQRAKSIREEYAYMDQMLLEGWIWEFVRRTKEYRQRCDKHSFSSSIHGDDVIAPIITISLSGINAKQYVVQRISIAAHKLLYFLFPRYAYRYSDFAPNCTPKIPRVHGIECFTFQEIVKLNQGSLLTELGTHDSTEDKVRAAFECLALGKIEDTLYIGISMNARIADIEKPLGSLIRQHLKQRQKRVIDKKWKFYLMVYDLKHEGLEYNEIADLLSEAYPENEKFSEGKNIGNYHKAALSLIEGGDYKKFLLF